ncbi:hypothetical protein QIS74_02592 [Colletotrichum tabaci]|uniref:Ubiquitin-like domain-containing protein n=1 Tax=Colletotrichum tabaci TaxID=1209068 RepID=A0AAV9TLC8_9PEZI
MSTLYVPPTVEEDAREDKARPGDEVLDEEIEKHDKKTTGQKEFEKNQVPEPTKKEKIPISTGERPEKSSEDAHRHDDAERFGHSITLKDAVGRKFKFPYEMVKLWSELETSTRDRISRHEQGIDYYDLSFYLPNEEVLMASRWSSLLKLDDVPLLRVSIEPFSDSESDAAASMK